MLAIVSDKSKHAPFGGELQVAVEKLAAIMLPETRSGRQRDIARQHVRDAADAKRTAETDLLAACRRHGVVAGRKLPPEVVDLQRRFDAATTASDSASKAYVASIASEGEAFLAAQNAIIETMLPTLMELTRLMNVAFTPLLGLNHHCYTRDLPAMRITQRSPELIQAVRVITAIMNEVSSPARSAT